MTDEQRQEATGPEGVRAALEALGDGYEVVRELGRGATAIVYLVRDHALQRDIAVKVIRSTFGADDEAMARLEREALLVARLQHPNIVKLYGTRHLADGSMVLLMEHVPGRDLREILQESGPLPPRRAVALLDDIASALAYAHRRRIVHRDVKPENIYVDDEVGTARLADFGVARPWDLDTRLTLPGESLGTPAYMAPEQIDGGDVDGRSDVFSLGLVAYEMLAGAHPWEGESIYSIIYKQKQEDPPPLRDLRPDLSDRLVHLVERAIRKDPAERWDSADAMLEALRALEDPEMDPLFHGIVDAEGEWTGGLPAAPGGSPPPPPAVAPPPVPRATPPPVPRAAPPPAPRSRSGPAGRPVPRPRPRRRWGRIALLAGAAAVAVALAWQPLELGEVAGGWRAAAVRLVSGEGRAARDGVVADPVETPAAPAPAPGPPRLLAGRGGNAQSGPVGSALAAPLRVQVLDAAGVGVPGVDVEFVAVSGTLSLDPPRPRSDDDGVATTSAVLPAVPQEIEVVARLPEHDGIETRFLLSAVPATGSAFGGVAGNHQVGAPGSRLPDALLLRVVDDAGEPVESAEVEFSTASGGTVTPTVDLTDENGWAVARWTLGPDAGTQEVVARLPGSDVQVVFQATAAAETEAPEVVTGPDTLAPDAPVTLSPAPSVARQGWDVGGTMVCVAGGGGRPFCRGGTSPSADVQGIVQLAAGVNHACGLDEGGRAWCWGANDEGQLGDGSRTPHAGAPVEGAVRFARIAAGLSHSCGLDADGQLWCWGANLSGQLGGGGVDDRSVPAAATTALRFSRLVAGWNHSCALTPSGQLHCWGLNAEGQLGDGSRVDRSTPVAVAGGAGFQDVAAGSSHTCGLRDGQVYCWGGNQHGQLGNGTVEPSLVPTPVVGLTGVASVVTGAAHTCARTTEGEVHCWGQNLHGQVGDGTTTSRSVPTRVSGDLRFTSILAGGAITCGVSTEGEQWCWGFNQDGQLGDGSRSHRASPTRVGG